MLEKEEMVRLVEDSKEQVDYYAQKVAKLEAENASLRLGRDANKRVKELEEEVEALKVQLANNRFNYQ